MTLDTHFIILDVVDPFEVFTFTRNVVGGGAELSTAQWELRPPHSSEVVRNYPLNHEIAMKPGQGFDAWIILHHREGEVLHYDHYEEDEETGEFREWLGDHPRGARVEISLDTTYGYRDGQGRGCGDLHADYVRALGQWCEERGWSYSWQNEFTGEWHDDWRVAAKELGASGRDMESWFYGSVVPAFDQLGVTTTFGGKVEDS